MDIAFKIVNSIRGSSLKRRLFQMQYEGQHELLLHTNLRWLIVSRGKFLQRFRDLLVWNNSHWNLDIQGKNKTAIDLISCIRAYKKIILLLEDLQQNYRNNFIRQIRLGNPKRQLKIFLLKKIYLVKKLKRSIFHMEQKALENEIIILQSHLILQARKFEEEFWKYINLNISNRDIRAPYA